jgi:hypothetical protein
VALTKATIPQSEFTGHPASYAVDGNIATLFCTANPYSQSPWLAVDLGSAQYVDTVIVVNENDANNPNRLDDFAVGLSNVSPSTSPPPWLSYPIACGQYSGRVAPDSSASVSCPLTAPAARYVIVQGHSDAICLREVKVYIRSS